jgi:hypothetical protein
MNLAEIREQIKAKEEQAACLRQQVRDIDTDITALRQAAEEIESGLHPGMHVTCDGKEYILFRYNGYHWLGHQVLKDGRISDVLRDLWRSVAKIEAAP